MANIHYDVRENDRESIALYVQEIFTDHKPGPDGNLVAVDKITFGKKGTSNYQRTDEVPRLMKQEPQIYNWVRPLYENWKKNNEIKREGMPLEAWPAITKGQIKACRDMGIFTVEDITTASSSIREKLGIGASDLMAAAKAFVENKTLSASANKIAGLEKAVETMTASLTEAQATIDALMAERGKKPVKPKMERTDG